MAIQPAKSSSLRGEREGRQHKGDGRVQAVPPGDHADKHIDARADGNADPVKKRVNERQRARQPPDHGTRTVSLATGSVSG